MRAGSLLLFTFHYHCTQQPSNSTLVRMRQEETLTYFLYYSPLPTVPLPKAERVTRNPGLFQLILAHTSASKVCASLFLGSMLLRVDTLLVGIALGLRIG